MGTRVVLYNIIYYREWDVTNMGTLEAAVWSMERPAYAFGWVWRVHVGAPASCGYCGSRDPACTHDLTHNGYTGRIMDPTGVFSGAKLTLDEPGLVCRTIIPPPATTIAKYGDAELDPRVCASPSLAQIWRAVLVFWCLGIQSRPV